jgi:membrane peptidoglycan carboxypeptidase
MMLLLKMKEHGFINEQEYGTALTEQVTFSKNDDNGIRAPHFVFFVREYLEEKYGTERVSEGGLTVVTTLDWKLQEQAEEIVKRNALKNEKVYNAENAALVAIDPKTGQILSMVGSRDYFDDKIDGKYNVAVAERQPGSSFKPFAYATAFAKGLRPETVVFDLPTQFSTNCAADDFSTSDTCYSPGNYDDTFRGPMSLRDALSQSVNIPAVKVLYIAGIKETLDTAKRLGITTLNRPLQQYGLPLVLGGGEVKLLDIVSAYGVFANNGTRHPATPILSIKDKEGDTVEEYTAQEEQALDSDVAKTINNVLSDNTARIPAFGANSALVISGRTVAAKTGTTNDYRDVWIIGYTPSIAVGAWAGNNNNTPMEKKVAGFIVAPLWNEFMQAALKDTVDEPFDPPSEKPDDVAPILKGVWQTEEGVHSILYWINKDAPLGPRPEYPARDGQFLLWEYPVQYWAQNGGVPAIPETSVAEVPSTPSTPSAPPFFITSPQQGARIPRNTLMTVQVSNPFGENLQKVSYSINGVFIGTSQGAPFSISFVPTTPGQTVIQVIGVSTLGEYRTQTTVFVE